MDKKKIISLAIVFIFLGSIGYFLFRPQLKPGEIPEYVTGEKLAVYGWAKTDIGVEILEQVPCYCGCKYSGHKHVRHCFWDDQGIFDDHGLTCAVCLNSGKVAMEMHNEGKDICEIRKFIDDFYKENKRMGTDTPMPAGC